MRLYAFLVLVIGHELLKARVRIIYNDGFSMDIIIYEVMSSYIGNSARYSSI